MGSVTYDFLANSLLLHHQSIENGFKNETNARIEKELQDYRKHCIDNYNDLIGEIKNRDSFLKVFSSTEETSVSLLKQTALYIDQFIVSDPLFPLTNYQSAMTKVTSQFLGYDSDYSVNKSKLTKAATFLKNVTPMVAGNYVKIFPLSFHFEAPKNVSINLPKDYYKDILPKEVLDLFWENASIRSLEKIPTGGWHVVEDKLYPCRGIVVDFKDTGFSSSLIYHLFEMEIVEFDESTGKALFRQTLPDTPPDKDHFDAWVMQSINSASKAYFDRVFQENFIAANLNSTYLCDNSFSSKLISRNFEVKESIQTYTASQFVNVELPFLENIDIEKLMTIRELDSDVFTNFRLELEKQFRELRTITDPKQLELKTQNIFHELNEVQVQKIKLKVKHLEKQMGANSLLALGGLMGSIQTSGLSLLATAVALGKGYKDYVDYKEKVRENPAYLLWKIKKKN